MSGLVRWIAEHRVDGVLHGRVGRSGDDLVAEWTGVARLSVRRDGSEVRFEGEAGAAPQDVEKIRRGSARLLLGQLAGKLALHGAAIAMDGRAIVLLGESAAGKSTLAASLCVYDDASLLADDAVALERTEGGLHVLALELDHWLDEEARRALGLEPGSTTGKRPTRAVSPAPLRAPLVAVVVLAFGSQLSRSPLSGAEAVASLLPHVVRFVVDEPELQRRELEALAHLVESTPVVRLERQRDLTRLMEAASAVRSLMEAR